MRKRLERHIKWENAVCYTVFEYIFRCSLLSLGLETDNHRNTNLDYTLCSYSETVAV